MNAQKRRRQSYSFEFKLNVVHRAEEIGNRAASREFDIGESMVREWRKKKVSMTKMPKRQRTCRTGIAKFPKEFNAADFTGGPSWCNRFMRRNQLSVRTRTTVGQQLPDDWETKVESFREFVWRRKTDLGITGDSIFNTDEVPMCFDAPYSRTVDETGVNTVPITTTGNEKTHFNVVLACSETGKKLAEATGDL